MLKAVSNIKLNSNPDHAANNGYRKSAIHNLIRDNDKHDSLDISRGYRILKDFHLQIKRFKKNKNGLLEITFDYDAVEFNTKLNLEELSTFLVTDYMLKYCNPDSKFNLHLHTRTFIDEYIDNIIKINDIKYLLERVDSLQADRELNVSNTRALTNLLDGIYNGVLNEFKQINSVLTSAAKNIFNIIQKNHSQADNNNEIIIVEKIIPPDEFN